MANKRKVNSDMEDEGIEKDGNVDPEKSSKSDVKVPVAPSSDGKVAASEPEPEIAEWDDKTDGPAPLPPHLNPFGTGRPFDHSTGFGFTKAARRAIARVDRRSVEIQPGHFWDFKDPGFTKNGRI